MIILKSNALCCLTTGSATLQSDEVADLDFQHAALALVFVFHTYLLSLQSGFHLTIQFQSALSAIVQAEQ